MNKNYSKEYNSNFHGSSIEMSLRILSKYACIFYRIPFKINNYNEIKWKLF